MKERCKAKARANAKVKAKSKSNPDFLWFKCVLLLVLAYLFSIPVVAISFSLLSIMATAANLVRSQRMLCPGPYWW